MAHLKTELVISHPGSYVIQAGVDPGQQGQEGDVTDEYSCHSLACYTCSIGCCLEHVGFIPGCWAKERNSVEESVV